MLTNIFPVWNMNNNLWMVDYHWIVNSCYQMSSDLRKMCKRKCINSIDLHGNETVKCATVDSWNSIIIENHLIIILFINLMCWFSLINKWFSMHCKFITNELIALRLFQIGVGTKLEYTVTKFRKEWGNMEHLYYSTSYNYFHAKFVFYYSFQIPINSIFNNTQVFPPIFENSTIFENYNFAKNFQTCTKTFTKNIFHISHYVK